MALIVSQGSGATLSTVVIGGEHYQRIAGVSINPIPTGSNYIGLASVSGNVNVQGLISLASGTFVSLNPSTNYLGLMSVSGNVVASGNVGITGLISLASGTQIGLNASSNYIGLASVNVGNVVNAVVTVAPRTDYIGLMSVSGNVNIANSPTVSVSGLISLASGTNIGLNPSANYIGLASVNVGNVVNAVVTIAPRTDYIGLVSVSGNVAISNPTVLISAPTLFAVVNTSAAGVGQSLVTINPRTDYIGLMSVSGNVNVTSLASGAVVLAAQSGNWTSTTYPQQWNGSSFESLTGDGTNGLKVRLQTQAVNLTALATIYPRTDYIGLVSVSGNVAISNATILISAPTLFAVVNTSAAGVGQSLVTINPRTDYIGLVSVSGNVNVQGLISLASGTLVGLNPSANYIGLASVNVGNVVNSIVTIAPRTDYIGLASVSGNVVNLAGTNYIGLASVNIGGTLPALTAGAAYIGLASVNVGNVVNSIVTIAPRTDYIGLASVSGNVVNLAGTNYIGLASVNVGNVVNSIVTIAPRTDYIGLVSVSGNVVNLAGTSFIGLATVVHGSAATVFSVPISTYTSLATVISASGTATLFIVPASTRWILKDLIVGSQGQTQVGIRSGANDVIPPIALATMGGYLSNFGDSGFRGKAVNDSFVVVNNSAVTISVTANVRFE